MKTSPKSVSGKSSSNALSDLAKSPLVLVWLPILVVGLLIFWLSGSGFPTAWSNLLQLSLNWDALQEAQGDTIYITLTILIVQSLCILAAWVMLLLVVVREGRELLAAKPRPRPAASTPPPPKPQPVVAQSVPTSLNAQVAQVADKTKAPVVEPDAKSVVEPDPFDMDEAVFDLLPYPEDGDDIDTLITKKSDDELEEEMLFVYGDPLEGDLPEIFDYDMDLKREVEEIRERKRTTKTLAEKNRAAIEAEKKDQEQAKAEADKAARAQVEEEEEAKKTEEDLLEEEIEEEDLFEEDLEGEDLLEEEIEEEDLFGEEDEDPLQEEVKKVEDGKKKANGVKNNRGNKA
jgi:hypothetical protein